MIKSCQVQIKNRLGLHTRPATSIVKLLQNFKSDVHFIHKEERANAKSILSLLMLAARRDTDITVEIDEDESENAEYIMEKIIELFDNKFGE